jgi:hypothetical protein
VRLQTPNAKTIVATREPPTTRTIGNMLAFLV